MVQLRLLRRLPLPAPPPSLAQLFSMDAARVRAVDHSPARPANSTLNRSRVKRSFNLGTFY
eukprot:282601-Pleurochrysis_carterae.AAC.2